MKTETPYNRLPSFLKEARQHGSFRFPCAFYQAVRETNPPGFPFTVKHHWHEPIEIIYLEQDSYQVDINMTLTHLKSPCFCFINSGELHALTSDSDQYREQAVVFSPDLLTFAAPDPAQEQFLLPLSEHKLSFPSFLGPEHPAFSEIQQEFFRIRSIFFRENRICLDQFTTENPVSQLRIKAALLNILGILAEHAQLASNEPVRNPRVELLKTVISHIRQNYQHPLSLGELAALAGMNEQYFCRFFKKSLGKTPVSYINDFRIRHAATLLHTTELQVTEVCLESGFNNLGHFMKEFKKATGFTPLQFRRQNIEETFSENKHSLNNERYFTMQKKWWHTKTAYQIYPKSFCDSNGDGIGDLPGIISKLDYLKDLGINIIWLSPIYCSPLADQGYDISDYYNIDPRFGTMDDMDRLIVEAKKRDMYILMDLVVNHCSDEHEWFKKACEDPDGEYGKYFYIEDCPDGKLPCNWRSYFGGSVWEPLPGHPDKYYLHMFHKKQPDLNWENPKVRDEVFDMMNWWCEKGIDGFRMDVISMISKPEGLPDGKIPEGGLYGDSGCVNGPHVHEYLQEMNKEVLSKYDLMTVGECAGVTIEEAEKYASADGKELSMVFQFELVELASGKYGKWTDKRVPLKDFKRVMTAWQTELEGKAWNSLFLGNHDQPRCLSRFGDDSPEYRVVSAKMLATCLHMMQGTPYVYQGDELGMKNVPFHDLSEFRDIESINAFHELTGAGKVAPDDMMRYLNLRGRDNARTPMQWDDTASAGFTTGTPWIKVGPDYETVNAKNEMADPDSVYNYYKKLIHLRKEKDIMVYGTYELLDPEDEALYVYTRTLGDQKLLVMCNFTKEEQEYTVPETFAGAEVLISNYPQDGAAAGTRKLRAYEAVVLETK